jgi:hypothetical protein
MPADRIDWVQLSLMYLPLATPVSDAKVLTGRQKPMTEIAFIFAEIRTRDGHEGLGFGYSKRAGGPGMYAHAKELAPNLLGEDPNDIARLFTKLLVGRRRPWAAAAWPRRPLPPIRHRAVGPEGPAREAAAGQAARRAPRLGAVLQHLRRLPAHRARRRC